MEENIKLIIPDYIKDEIEKYKWKKENGKGGMATYDNILALIRLAVVNNRITEQQAKEIREYVQRLQ